ncbi:DNA helicase [Microbacterium phage Erenyeager]|nr:DNA helicase [Microbacterium phage Erenyeager]
MTKLTAKPEQSVWIDQFVQADTKGGILGLGTGVGKTFVNTEIARLRGAKRVLIMAPQSTFDSWYDTVYWQTGKKLMRAANNGLKFNHTPDPSDRDTTMEVALTPKQCKANLEALQGGSDGWYFITRELFRTQAWEKVPVKKDGVHVIDPKTKKLKYRNQQTWVWDKKGKHPFDVVILDENQNFASLGNRGQGAFRMLSGFKIASSADWFGSQVENMHTVAVDIFGQEEVGLSKPQFVDEYLETEYDHFAVSKQRVTGEQIPGLFASELPLYVTAPPSVTPPEPDNRYVTLSKAERDLYDKLQEDYIAEVGDEILEIEVPLALRIRLRELSLGMFKVRKTGEITEDGIEKTTVEYEPGAPSSKLEEVKAILADYPNEKFVIFTHSAKFAEKAAIDLGGKAWTGNRTTAEKAAIKKEFIQGDLRLFTATAETMGTGTDGLQRVCRNVIVLSPSDQVIVNTQGISRIARQGQERQVNVWNIIARNTFDQGVIQRNGMKVRINSGAKGWG